MRTLQKIKFPDLFFSQALIIDGIHSFSDKDVFSNIGDCSSGFCSSIIERVFTTEYKKNQGIKATRACVGPRPPYRGGSPPAVAAYLSHTTLYEY